MVRYYTAWFESDHLYIQTELCERSLEVKQGETQALGEQELVAVMQQVTLVDPGRGLQTTSWRLSKPRAIKIGPRPPLGIGCSSILLLGRRPNTPFSLTR